MTVKAKRHKRLFPGRILKRIRVAVSLAMLAVVTLLVTTLEARIALALDPAAHLQLMPLALAGAGTAVALWLAVTIIFGRLYCSTVCPMGTLQDIFSHLRHMTRRSRMRHPFHYSAPRNRFRYAFLTVVAGCAIVGVAVIPTLFDPYSAYGRICSELLQPIVRWGEGAPVFVASWLAFGIAAATLAAVAWFSFRHGRIICNTVCPVGSSLSIFSRYSLFHFDIDTDLCINCRQCERACKAECISMADHVVDGSRCVACFNCVDVCDTHAISYTFRRKRLSLPLMQRVESAPTPMTASPSEPRVKDDSKPVRIDRRKFLATGLLVAATPAIGAVSRGTNRIAALTTGGKPLERTRPVVPPGRRNMADFLEKCTGCGLCVAHCPAKVLRPSSNELGWLHMLHPIMDFERSYCRYNCTRCTELCPTGALLPLTPEEKHIFIIGHARVEAANCIGCGLCSTRCPRHAITMTVRPEGGPGSSLMLASVDTSLCIGCGACEYICPATPVKAIVVNGIV